MIKVVITAVLISFGISAVACPVLIPFLKKIKFGQQVREDGPQAHLKKQGTPTMGGIAFLFSVILTSLFFMKSYPQIIPILFMTVGFGFVGFLDDYIKVVRKHSEGLNPKQKMAAQFVITAIFCFYMMKYSGGGTVIHIPFLHTDWDMGWLYIPMVFLVVLGTDNGVNFTDGLDGLCTSVTIIVATFFTVVAMTTVSGIVPITGAVVGALLGFLLFNVYPAQVFMGDTGSLALGGFVASTALVLQNPLIILLIGFIYLIEVISVMIQVVYFKKTHGKRFFRMAPIHHHFELGGWSETRVVAVFTTVTALLCLIALLS
ncbi:MAG: phospho-N-acetylmuramoyl-pentapeptide-transferase [Lachnospiraceae bacterium]|uniref:Phospho-N-acetylmuramoyl-pentapeptide-transferase n=1 Tax=Hominifimenecus microfluidus TaxID=2885348 RepID=A0AAE3E8R2_9FIRM|nr:phospho-N-acetylmuramoyl-pentapeptide-transferase [Hominifimenecus microfluidus]MCC2230249.1 phospho-N-acetylmuramoyl-pentapeptide-transferase [Hominifimenecus microfluidus]